MAKALIGEWADQGECAKLDPKEADALFFPKRGDSTAEAKQICASCPVRVRCREFAIETHQDFGIWGGTSILDRRRIIRARRRGLPDPPIGAGVRLPAIVVTPGRSAARSSRRVEITPPSAPVKSPTVLKLEAALKRRSERYAAAEAAHAKSPEPKPEPDLSPTMASVKNAHAVALGRLGGKKGGRARAEKLSPERRREIASKAAQARWLRDRPLP